MTYKFKIGEIVFLRPSLNQNSAGGAYIILQRLPQYYGEFKYQSQE